MSGLLWVVATPIGNLEDMSYRAVRVLREADIVAAEDTRAARVLLDRHDIRPARLVSLFAGNEATRTEELCGALDQGRTVAMISQAGTPGISDPGERLVRAAAAAGARIEVIPGPVALIAALVASGLPAARFTFLGFPPRDAGARHRLFGSLRTEVATLILYESPERVPTTLDELARALGDDRPAALCRELTKRFEETVRAPLGELAARYRDAPPRGECTVVVRGAAAEAETLAPEAIEAAMRELLAEGLSARDAAARLVLRTGKPRRQLYQLALSIKRADERRGDG